MKKVLAISVLLNVAVMGPVLGADCNGNGIEDGLDLPQDGFSFAGPPSYPVPGGPRAIVAADLDGDGHLDVAASTSEGTVTVFLQHGGDALGQPAVYPASPCCGQLSLAAADLDRDGDLDLVLAQDIDELSPGLWVLRNAGQGAFENGLPVEGKGRLRALAAADLNADGDIDIAAAGEFNVSLFFNGGGGRFELPRQVLTSLNPFAIVAGDFDNDGHTDLATGNAGFQMGVEDTVSVFMGPGPGEPAAPRNFSVGEGRPAMAARDIDGDGKLDIVVANNVSNTVTGLMGNGAGGFAPRPLLALGGPLLDDGLAPALVVEDLDRDGDLDLAVTSPSTNQVVIAFQDSAGDFGDSVSRVTADLEGTAGSRLQALGAADLDGDKDPDLIVAHLDPGVGQGVRGGSSGSLMVLLNRAGRFAMGRNRTIPTSSAVYFVTAADLNADGRPDIITTENDSISVLLQGELTDFPNPVSYAAGSALGEGGNPLTVADLDGDGDLDLAKPFGLSVKPGSVSVLLNRGDGRYQDASSYPTGSTMPIFLIAGDLDGDEAPDLATANMGWNGTRYGVGPQLSVLRNLGDGSFAPGVGYDSGQRSDNRYANFVTAADLNEDGSLDLALSISGPQAPPFDHYLGNGTVAVFLNDGQGSFQASRDHEALDTKPGRLILADLDQDGHVDLAAAGGSVFLGDGTGSFPRIKRHLVGAEVASDLDGDGTLDIAAGGGDRVFILFGSGGGQFGDLVGYPIPDAAPDARINSPVIAADLNGDGRSELVAAWFGPSGAGVLVYVNSGGQAFTPRLLKTSPSLDLDEPQSLTVADLDRDGRLEILTANLTTADPRFPGGGGVTVLFNLPEVSTSLDLNHNGVPDECEPPLQLFHRGDPNSSGTIDISDAITIFGFLFLGDPPALSCKESADVNNDGAVDISDGIYLLEWLFLGGDEPPKPGPTKAPCGIDPDLPGSPGDLGCESYSCN